MFQKIIMHCAVVCIVAAILSGYRELSYALEPDRSAGVEKKDRRVTSVVAFTAYYANWSPAWKKYRFTYVKYSEGDFSLPRGTFMYGPSVSVTIDRWQISANFLYGEFRGDLVTYDYIPPLSGTGYGFMIPYRVRKEVKKYDGDLLVGYEINKYFRFFFGPKYQGYQYKKIFSTSLITSSSEDIRYHSGGMGVGVGCTLPITGDFYLTMNFAGVVLVGSQKGSDDKSDRTSIAYGGNEIVKLVYEIKPIHTIISLGGRLQYLYFYTTPNKYNPGKHDIFYGINLSAGAWF